MTAPLIKFTKEQFLIRFSFSENAKTSQILGIMVVSYVIAV